MTVTLSRTNLHTLLGDEPTALRWASVAYEHVKDRPHRVWLGILLDLTRQAQRAGVESTMTPARLLVLCDRYSAQQRRRRRTYWSWR